jgi:hypothetical protein
MDGNDPVTHFQRRAAQYHLADGTFELFFGGICLLWALFFYLQDRLSSLMPEGLVKTIVWMAGFIAVSFGGSFLFERSVKAIKARFTYPRTGYVEARQPRRAGKWTRLLGQMIVAAVLAALFVAFFASHPASVNWIPLASGGLFALAMLVVAWRSRLWRYNLAAVLSALLGLGTSLLGLDELTGIAAFYGSMGFLLLIMGGIVLGLYLRQNPPPPEPSNER